MAPKAKAKTRAEQTAENRGRTYVAAMDPATRGARPQTAENIDRLVRERDEARREANGLRAVADELRAAASKRAKDAKRWRETCDRLRFALDVVRERDELRAEADR